MRKIKKKALVSCQLCGKVEKFGYVPVCEKCFNKMDEKEADK